MNKSICFTNSLPINHDPWILSTALTLTTSADRIALPSNDADAAVEILLGFTGFSFITFGLVFQGRSVNNGNSIPN